MPWNHSGQCPLWPMTVAHDHGYCYLQTKDVSGAAFDGASDGGVVSSTRTDQNVKQGEGSIKTGGIRKTFFFLTDIFLPSHFFLKIHLASLLFIARYSLTGFENANASSTCSSLKTDIPNSVKITEYMNS